MQECTGLARYTAFRLPRLAQLFRFKFVAVAFLKAHAYRVELPEEHTYHTANRAHFTNRVKSILVCGLVERELSVLLEHHARAVQILV